MTFPVIAATNGGNRITNSTSHTLNLPAGISVGDLLIAVAVFDGNPTVTWPAGWTSIHAGAANSNAARIEARYRIADGGEGASIALTTSASEMFCYNTIRINTWHGTTPPESSAGAVATSTAPNADSLTPSWGSADTLWLSCAGYNHGQRWATAGVTSYNYVEWTHPSGSNQRADNSSGCGVMVHSRALAAASEDPGASAISSSQEWRAFTVAVRPAGGGGATGRSQSIIIA